MMLTYLVLCPRCGGRQKTQPAKLANSVKKCVYCGRSFAIRSITKDRVIAKCDYA